MSLMCVQLFIELEKAVLKFKMYLGECHKIQDGYNFHGKRNAEKIISVFSLIFFGNFH